MSEDAIQKRFFDEITLRGYDDKYIDKNEEREILQIAIHQGIGVDSARGALVAVCAAQGYVLESTLLANIKEHCEKAAANEGRIDQRKFAHILAEADKTAQGKRNERDLKKLVVTVMEDHGMNKIKTGWLSNWYRALKRDLGMR